MTLCLIEIHILEAENTGVKIAEKKEAEDQMNNISFKQYRTIDLMILAVILCFAEFVTSKAASVWFPGQLYTISPTIAVVCIVMMRWSGFAAIHAVLGGLTTCMVSFDGASVGQFAIYCVGNLFMLLPLILIKILGKQKIMGSAFITVCYTVLAFLGGETGRWLVSLFVAKQKGSFLMFVATDLITLLFSIVVTLIARKVDGLFEDQKAYLIRTEAERMRARSEE